MSAKNIEVRGESRVELTSTCSLLGKVTCLTKPQQDQQKFDVRDIHSFLGVPYAKPPVGDLMFRDPVPLELWQGQRTATEFGPACPQNLKMLEMVPIKCDPPSRMDVDCLYLNVWTPNTSRDAKLPVMVWFYGGGFVSGYTDMFRAEVLANCHDVVIVTVCYRVGVWGFLCTGDSAATGNYGLLDQVEGLKWVNKYIENFGGDSNNVTIFGESAGGISVACHMMSPLSKGLFKNAISESGTVLTMGDIKPAAEASASLSKYLKHLGCESTKGTEIVSFLRSQPTEKLIVPPELMMELFFVPVVDGKFLTKRGSENIASRNLAKANHLIGVNRDEGAFLAFALSTIMQKDPATLDQDSARAIIQASLATRFSGKDTGKLVDAIMAEYCANVKPGEDLMKAIIAVIGDVTFIMPAISTADVQSGISKVYFYSFNKRNDFVKYPAYVNADHANEIPSVFGLPYIFPHHLEFSAKDWAVSRKIMSYWTNFAKTGNPNGAGLLEWPEYNKTERKYIVLDDPITQSSNLKAEKVKFWNDALAKFMS